jgi:cystathionine beta-lyase/cystathionine gamma-synthase
MEQIFFRAYLLLGGILHPFDSWLLLRGLRTLPVRMQQHEADALRVAEFLRMRPEVGDVHHPAFMPPSSSMLGCSGLFSFDLKDAEFEQARQFVDSLKRFRIGVSLGGVESLAIAANRRTNLKWLDVQKIPHGLIRLSIGLEGAEVLIEDIGMALDSLSS